MLKKVFFLLSVLFFISCNNKKTVEQKEPHQTKEIITNSYAKGFEVVKSNDYTVLTLNNPWPNSEKTFSYLLLEKGKSIPKNTAYDAIVEVPLKKVVVTSTTHIPALEALSELETLVGFPNTTYISSEKARKRIDSGLVKDIGNNQSMNTEVLLSLQPDAVVGFAVNGDNKTFNTVEKAGIPVLYNGDWTEAHPLGKAEWIKFFGYLFKKEKEAVLLFKQIENDYLKAKEIALNASKKPTVISGGLYKDVWYMPYGNSWGAQLIKDANGTYLWGDTEGSGSISLSIEAVLSKGENAQFWIGPGSANSLDELLEKSHHYNRFEAFKTGKVYNFANKKGATGGLLYYELAPNRPDLVLKDIIKILHPDLLPDHKFYFYNQLP